MRRPPSSSFGTSCLATAILWIVLAAPHSASSCSLPVAWWITVDESEHETLRPDPVTVARYQAEIDRIAQAFPYLGTLCARARWQPGALLVAFEDEETFEQLISGTWAAAAQLHEEIGYVGFRESSSCDLTTIEFDPWIDPVALGRIYIELPGVRGTSANVYGSFTDCIPEVDRTEEDGVVRWTFEAHLDDDWRTCIIGRWRVELVPWGVILRDWNAEMPTDASRTTWGSLKSRYR